jgi:hypothetical protein
MNATKAGARHSSADQGHIQAAHDRLTLAGAVCNATKAWTPASAIKSVGGGKVEGLLCRYSTPMATDVERDFFNKTSDFGVKDGQELPVLWHHNLDPEKRGVIGKGIVQHTDAGLWFQSWLNQRDEYERLILKMIEMGKAGYSGGASAIARLASVGKSRLITTFHLVEGSITPVPADPGNLVSIKAFISGGSLTDEQDAEIEREIKSERKADLLQRLARLQETDEAKRARLLRELDRIDPGRRDRTNEPRPGPVVGSWATPFDPNADTGRRTW